jgi:sugar lactone lactonase YvrE
MSRRREVWRSRRCCFPRCFCFGTPGPDSLQISTSIKRSPEQGEDLAERSMMKSRAQFCSAVVAVLAAVGILVGCGGEGKGALPSVEITGQAIITTVVGTGEAGFSGDGSSAMEARINAAEGLVFAEGDSFFFADTGNHRVRKVGPDGVVTTVAGTGEPGFSGDGGPATSAQLNNPSSGLALDEEGNLFVADFFNSRIRRIATDGTITTVAGGDPPELGDGGQATAATLTLPGGVAVDADGNLIIADHEGNRIRKVDGEGVITTIAGTGEAAFGGDGGPAVKARLNNLADVSIDAMGNIYVPDRDNQRIRKIDSGGIISTIAGTGEPGFSGDGGPARSARLDSPLDVVLDSLGNVYVADTQNHRVRKIDSRGIISTVAGSQAGFSGDGGPAASASLLSPAGLAFDSAGNLYIADTGNNRIRKLTPKR